ncbi:MAG: PQQ-binding-like beta-propeller repeat protein [Pirellulales bacterium]|nr:PQQ-binding-like beta-propeller repeat protein [Pirellulales bacterium]
MRTTARHFGRLGLTTLLLLVSAFETAPVVAQDLERFLPNHGNSVYEAKGLLRQWPAGGPKELWRAEIGWGKSAVVEARGKAFTATETDDKQYAVCLDPLSGEVLWKSLLYPKNNRHFVKGPVTSPVVDGDRVYFIPYAVDRDVWDMCAPILCLKTDGSELWRQDTAFFGTEASTPIVVGDTLYVSTDSRDRIVLVALDTKTGDVRWSIAMKETEKGRELGAPASLTYQVVDGIPQIITATYGTQEILGVHAATGQIMWRYSYPAPISIGLVATPVAIGTKLFLCAGEGKGKDFSALLEMKVADGKIAYEEVYLSSEFQNNAYNTPAIYRDAVFGFGGNKTAGFLHATNLADGSLLWKHADREWTNQQNLVVADGLIFALSKNNELVLAEASREGYKELGRVDTRLDLERPQQPTVANGRLYLRGTDTVVCYRVIP